MTSEFPSTSNKRRLLIRPGGIGDCLLCFPAMQFLRWEYTEVWTTAAVAPLIHFADAAFPISSTGLDLLGIGDLAAPARLRSRLENFDEIVTWYGAERPEFREALRAINPHCRFLPALPPPGHHAHAADFFTAQVGAPRGQSPRLQLPAVANRDTVVIHPFSGGKRKNWPLAYFRELECGLPLPVEWVAGPEEELDQAHRFDSLLDLAVWLGGSRLYIGNDSGITHVAAASGVTTVALFGPTDPAVWAPREATVMRSEPLLSLLPSAVLSKTLQLLGLSASSAESDSARL